VSEDKGLFVDDIRVVVSNDKGHLLAEDDMDDKQVEILAISSPVITN
jgi:hypothetical protein